MANHHFGNYGDVWKHLLLAEILLEEQPGFVLESHAGSACYEVTPEAEREHGVGHYLNVCNKSGELVGARFTRLLRNLHKREGGEKIYPGSPLIDLRVCAEHRPQYIFCDIDEESLATIREAAELLEVPTENVQLSADDGVLTIAGALEELDELQRLGTLVIVDPFDLFEKNAAGLSSLDLFGTAASSGAMALLWYAYGGSGPTQEEVHQALLGLSRRHELDHAEMWWAELALTAAAEGGPWSEMLPGCGMVLAGLGKACLRRCTALSESLAATYATCEVPGGAAGRLALTRPQP
ncbi:MAG: hypothetical protein ACF8SC_10185 [Phycisphaerales bacterium JB037]